MSYCKCINIEELILNDAHLRPALALVGHHDDDSAAPDGGEGGGVGGGDQGAVRLERHLVRKTQGTRNMTSSESDTHTHSLSQGPRETFHIHWCTHVHVLSNDILYFLSYYLTQVIV